MTGQTGTGRPHSAARAVLKSSKPQSLVQSEFVLENHRIPEGCLLLQSDQSYQWEASHQERRREKFLFSFPSFSVLLNFCLLTFSQMEYVKNVESAFRLLFFPSVFVLVFFF